MTKFYYADYTPLVDTFFAGSAFSTVSENIDTTDMPNNDRCQTWAMTFRVGTDWVTKPSRMYQGIFRMYQAFDQSGKAVHLNIGSWQHMERLNFGFTSDYFLGLQFTPEEFSPYRNRWLGLVSATSDKKTDFTNWHVSEKNKHNYYVRNILVDLETKKIIKMSDRNAYAVKDSIDFSKPWQIANNTQTAEPGQYFNSSFLLMGARNYNQEIDSIKLEHGQNQYQCLSTWTAMGSTLDPVEYWPQLTGTGLSSKVNSVRAWSLLEFSDSGRWIDDTYLGNTTYWPPKDPVINTRRPGGLPWNIFSRKRSNPAASVYQPYIDQ